MTDHKLMNSLNKRLNEDQKGFLLKKFTKFRFYTAWLNELRKFYNRSCNSCQRLIIDNPIELDKSKLCDKCKKLVKPFNEKSKALFKKAGAVVK